MHSLNNLSLVWAVLLKTPIRVTPDVGVVNVKAVYLGFRFRFRFTCALVGLVIVAKVGTVIPCFAISAEGLNFKNKMKVEVQAAHL